jgi:hypothetical protein
MGIMRTLRRAFGRGDDQDDDEDDADGFTPGAKDPANVAKRFVLLVLVAELADSIVLEAAGARDEALAMRTHALDQLLRLGFTPGDLEEREWSFVMSLRTGNVDRNDATAALWRLECAGVLAWGIRACHGAPARRAFCGARPLRFRLPADAASLRAFADGATVRPLPDLLAARHEMSMRWFSLEGAPPSEKRSRVLERMRTIRWLTEPALLELSATQVLSV